MIQESSIIQDLIVQGIPGASVRLDSLRHDGEPYLTIQVTSPAFEGKTRLEQHRMVYAALKNHVDFENYPLSLQTLAFK
jgi:stress-induced morphogen